MKKVLKDIIYCEVADIYEEEFDLPISINGKCLVNTHTSKAEGIKILTDVGMIQGDNVIIPKGLELTEINQFGGASEYNFNNGQIKIDIAFDNDDEAEYIG